MKQPRQMITIPYADYEELVSFASCMYDDRQNIDPFYRSRAEELYNKHHPHTFGGELSPYTVTEESDDVK